MFKIKIDSRFFPFSKAASPVGHIRSSIEELRWAHNPKVGGSKPPSVTETIVEWSITPGNGPGEVGSNPTGLIFLSLLLGPLGPLGPLGRILFLCRHSLHKKRPSVFSWFCRRPTPLFSFLFSCSYIFSLPSPDPSVPLPLFTRRRSSPCSGWAHRRCQAGSSPSRGCCRSRRYRPSPPRGRGCQGRASTSSRQCESGPSGAPP